MAVSLKQIADSCGVSRQTVGYILTGKKAHLFRPETREKVLAAARSLGYRPHAGAQSMVSKRFNAIGMLCGKKEQFSYIHHRLLEYICYALEEREMHLTLAFLPDEQIMDEENRPKFLSHCMIDGLILNYTNNNATPRGTSFYLNQSALPCVWLNIKQRNNAVYPDDFGAACTLVRQLADAGIRDIFYFNEPQINPEERTPRGIHHYSIFDRLGGYLEAMRACGLPPRLFTTESADLTAKEIRQLNASGKRTAVITYSATHAFRIFFLLGRNGITVPEQTVIIGYNPDLFNEPEVDRAISIARVPQAQMGLAAVEMLMKMLAEKSQKTPARTVEYSIDLGL